MSGGKATIPTENLMARRYGFRRGLLTIQRRSGRSGSGQARWKCSGTGSEDENGGWAGGNGWLWNRVYLDGKILLYGLWQCSGFLVIWTSSPPYMKDRLKQSSYEYINSYTILWCTRESRVMELRRPLSSWYLDPSFSKSHDHTLVWCWHTHALHVEPLHELLLRARRYRNQDVSLVSRIHNFFPSTP